MTVLPACRVEVGEVVPCMVGLEAADVLANLRLSFTDIASSVYVLPNVQLTKQVIIMAKYHVDSVDPASGLLEAAEAEIIRCSSVLP